MERLKLEKVIQEKLKSNSSKTRYLLTHPDLGVFIGLRRGQYFWSNLESGGNDSALLLERESLNDPIIKNMLRLLGREFGNQFQAKPCEGDSKFLSMEECVRLGFNKWCSYSNNYFTSYLH